MLESIQKARLYSYHSQKKNYIQPEKKIVTSYDSTVYTIEGKRLSEAKKGLFTHG